VENEQLNARLEEQKETLAEAREMFTQVMGSHRNQLAATRDQGRQVEQQLQLQIDQLQQACEDYRGRAQQLELMCAQQTAADISILADLAFPGAGKDSRRNSATSMPPPAGEVPLGPSGDAPDPVWGEPRLSITTTNISHNTISNTLPPNPPTPEGPQVLTLVQQDAGHSSILQQQVLQLQQMLQEKEAACVQLQQVVDALRTQLAERANERAAELERQLAAREEKIVALSAQINTIEPEISVKVAEMAEKDKIIEEKSEKISQQNKILVEIQITLDERLKQIQELEAALEQTKKALREVQDDYEKSCVTLTGFVADASEKERQMTSLRRELRRQEKKCRDLANELRETLDMLGKARWEAETGGGEAHSEALAEEHERLWSEVENSKAQLVALEQEKALHRIQMAEKNGQLHEKEAQMAEKDGQLVEKESQLAEKDGQLVEKEAQMAEKDGQLVEKEAQMVEKESQLVEKESQLAEKDGQLVEKESKLANLEGSLAEIQQELEQAKQTINHLQQQQRAAPPERCVPPEVRSRIQGLRAGVQTRLATLGDLAPFAAANPAQTILQKRLQELCAFLQRVLEDRSLDLSHLSGVDRGDLRKSLDLSRRLSFSLNSSFLPQDTSFEDLFHGGEGNPEESLLREFYEDIEEKLRVLDGILSLVAPEDQFVRPPTPPLTPPCEVATQTLVVMPPQPPVAPLGDLSSKRLLEMIGKDPEVMTLTSSHGQSSQRTELTGCEEVEDGVKEVEDGVKEVEDEVKEVEKSSNKLGEEIVNQKPLVLEHRGSPSGSEAWSEPDRSVSLARMGLSPNGLNPLSPNGLNPPTGAHSSGSDTEDSHLRSSPQKTGHRRGPELRRLSLRVRELEGLNLLLRREIDLLSPKEDTPAGLLGEIRSLRGRLEQSIANNDQLRLQLELALDLPPHLPRAGAHILSLTQALLSAQESLGAASARFSLGEQCGLLQREELCREIRVLQGQVPADPQGGLEVTSQQPPNDPQREDKIFQITQTVAQLEAEKLGAEHVIAQLSQNKEAIAKQLAETAQELSMEQAAKRLAEQELSMVRDELSAKLAMLRILEEEKSAAITRAEELSGRLTRTEDEKSAAIGRAEALFKQLSESEDEKSAMIDRANILSKQLSKSDDEKTAAINRAEKLIEDLGRSEGEKTAALSREENLSRQLGVSREEKIAALDRAEQLLENLSRLEDEKSAAIYRAEELLDNLSQIEEERTAAIDRVENLSRQLNRSEEEKSAAIDRAEFLVAQLEEKEKALRGEEEKLRTELREKIARVEEKERELRGDEERVRTEWREKDQQMKRGSESREAQVNQGSDSSLLQVSLRQNYRLLQSENEQLQRNYERVQREMRALQKKERRPSRRYSTDTVMEEEEPRSDDVVSSDQGLGSSLEALCGPRKMLRESEIPTDASNCGVPRHNDFEGRISSLEAENESLRATIELEKQRKQKVERAMGRQLLKTHKVLQTVEGSLTSKSNRRVLAPVNSHSSVLRSSKSPQPEKRSPQS